MKGDDYMDMNKFQRIIADDYRLPTVLSPDNYTKNQDIEEERSTTIENTSDKDGSE